LSPDRRPADLRVFAPIEGPAHTAPSTPGDLLFHLRAEREDMTFELERQLLDVIGDAATVVDETTGFRYFDARDLLGFVDGTATPTRTSAAAAMWSCRSTSTTWPPGPRCRPRTRRRSWVARRSTTSRSTTT